MVIKVTLVDYITWIKEKGENIKNRYLVYNLAGYLFIFLNDNSHEMYDGSRIEKMSDFTYVEWCLNRLKYMIENCRM